MGTPITEPIRGIVTAEKSLNLRDRPDGKIIGDLKHGDSVQVDNEARTGAVAWYHLTDARGRELGWSAARYIALQYERPPPDVHPLPPLEPEPSSLGYIAVWGVVIAGLLAVILYATR